MPPVILSCKPLSSLKPRISPADEPTSTGVGNFSPQSIEHLALDGNPWNQADEDSPSKCIGVDRTTEPAEDRSCSSLYPESEAENAASSTEGYADDTVDTGMKQDAGNLTPSKDNNKTHYSASLTPSESHYVMQINEVKFLTARNIKLVPTAPPREVNIAHFLKRLPSCPPVDATSVGAPRRIINNDRKRPYSVAEAYCLLATPISRPPSIRSCHSSIKSRKKWPEQLILGGDKSTNLLLSRQPKGSTRSSNRHGAVSQLRAWSKDAFIEPIRVYMKQPPPPPQISRYSSIKSIFKRSQYI
jgi:hypothetical protein